MPHSLDHLLWAAPDLAAGVARFADLSGVMAAAGGEHPGFGTRNALVALSGGAFPDSYLEIIAPDPAQDLAGTRGERLAALAAPTLLTFALRSSDLERSGELVSAAGLVPAAPIAMSRRRPDGEELSWRILRVEPTPFGELMPFFIDWGASEHPARSTSGGCVLKRFEVGHPQATELEALYRTLEIFIPVRPAAAPELRARLDSPRGEITLAG